MTGPEPLLVAGGGIGGLATALALARRGHRATVLERRERFGEVGAGLQLGPNGVRALRRLGCADAVLARAVPVRRLLVLDGPTGDAVVQLELHGAFRERFGPYVVAHRQHLHRALLDACRGSGLVQLCPGNAVAGFEAHGSGVRVRLADGRDVTGSALVGADGLSSVVRQGLLDDGPPRPSGHTTYRAVLPWTEVPAFAREPDATLWAGAGRHAVHYPIDGGRQVNVVVTVDDGADRALAGVPAPAAEVRAAFAAFDGRLRELLAVVPQWLAWVLCDREPVSGWSVGPVTLLGDAAHPMLQYAAQGACIALEDALELAAQVDARGDPARAFAAYAAARAPRAARVQRTARGLGRDLYHATGPAALVRAARLAGLDQERLRDEVAWLYQDDEGDERTGAVQMTTRSQQTNGDDFERDVREHRMALLWERLGDLVTPQPRSAIRPHVWRWKQVREVLLEAGRRISAEAAERRVLILENPGAVGQSRITTSLYAGLQLVLPGEVAPAHRHSQSALRLVLEGDGGHTVVDGHRLPTVAGDLLVTPPMGWHDHGNDSERPVIWLDLLDIPLVQHLDASFFEPGPQRAQAEAEASPTGPQLRFDLEGMRARLEAVRAAGPPDRRHGYRVEYAGAADRPLLSTMTANLSLLPAGWSSAFRRSTDATIYVPLRGEGSSVVGDTVLEWGPRDVFVVPSWAPVRHRADAETLLFACSDRVAQRALGLFREELGD